MAEKTNGGRRATEMEGRVSTLEAGQEAIQDDIRELTQVVTELAHETRRSLSAIQRPNWQYLAVLLGAVMAIGTLYSRDQESVSDRIDGVQAKISVLQSGRVEAAYSSGKHDGRLETLTDRVSAMESDLKEHETLRGHQGVLEAVDGLKESVDDLQVRTSEISDSGAKR